MKEVVIVQKDYMPRWFECEEIQVSDDIVLYDVTERDDRTGTWDAVRFKRENIDIIYVREK